MSKVYLTFYVFLSKILSIFIAKTNTRATHSLSRPICFFVLSPLVTLFDFLSREGIYLLPAENEDLTVTEDFRGLSPALP